MYSRRPPIVDRARRLGKVRLNYLVDAASWRPQYKLRAARLQDPCRLNTLLPSSRIPEDCPTSIWCCPPRSPCSTRSPPELQTLNVAVVHKNQRGGFAQNRHGRTGRHGQEPAQQGAKDFNDASRPPASGCSTRRRRWISRSSCSSEAAVAARLRPGGREGAHRGVHINTPLAMPVAQGRAGP